MHASKSSWYKLTKGWNDPAQVWNDLATIVDYMWKDERQHWEESDKPNEHIFLSLCRIRRHFLEEGTVDKCL